VSFGLEEWENNFSLVLWICNEKFRNKLYIS
jgi:hypothetical protein